METILKEGLNIGGKFYYKGDEFSVELRGQYNSIIRLPFGGTATIENKYLLFEDSVFATIEVERGIVENIVKYCEAQQVYDKLGNYGDFYYKLKRLLK